MESRRLICGNPYSFQGDERHIIFLSMIADSNVRNVFNRPADQRRFNVAASRAQDQMWLFHTATLNDLSQHCLRKTLLQYFCDPRSQASKSLGEEADELIKVAYSANRLIEKPPKPFDSWFELDVALKIASKGYRVIPQFPFASKRIDLVIEGLKSKLAVECDGDNWHGVDEYEDDLERQRMLERCGWIFFRIRECTFNANPDLSLEKLWGTLDRMGIKPVGAKKSELNVEDVAGLREENIARLKEEDESKYQIKDSFKKDLFSGFVDTSKLSEEVEIEIEEKLKSLQINNVQQALAMKPVTVRGLVVKMLQNRPNCSCVKSAASGLLLKDLNVISRGAPRQKFGRKVSQTIRYLEENGVIETYKSKNIRIRLVGK